MNAQTKEIQDRLIELLDGFADADATANADEGVDGHGLVLRLVVEGQFIEVRVSVEDVTADLTGSKTEDVS